MTVQLHTVHLVAEIPNGQTVDLEKTAVKAMKRLNRDGLCLACAPYTSMDCWLWFSVQPMPDKRWGLNLNRSGCGIEIALENSIVFVDKE